MTMMTMRSFVTVASFFGISVLVATATATAAFVPAGGAIRGGGGGGEQNHRRTTTTTSSVSALEMATIAVIGASGLTAQECVYQALRDGHSVIGLTRNTANVVIPKGSGGSDAGQRMKENDKLTLLAGDVTNMSDVDRVFNNKKVDGVIIALGGKTSDVGETMLRDGTANVISAMKRNGSGKRLAVVTSIGAGDSENQAPFFFKVLMWTAMKKIFQDKNAQEQIVRNSGNAADLEWTIVRPGGLTVEPPTGIVNVINGEAGSIARADVARFCLDAILVPDFPYLKQAPCISSVGGTSWVKDRSEKARSGQGMEGGRE